MVSLKVAILAGDTNITLSLFVAELSPLWLLMYNQGESTDNIRSSLG